jgi:sec-independent protein translocase protein TatA
MGGLSFMHWLIILAIVLLIFGPSRLPGLGKSLGSAIRGFKKGLSDDEIDVTDSTRKEQIRDGEGGTQTHQTETKKDKV